MAANWLAIATRECSTMPFRCAKELVAMPTICSVVVTSVDLTMEVWVIGAKRMWLAACRYVA